MWALVMAPSRSRAICVEFVRTADTASFMQCHGNTFDYPGGAPRRCPYDNATVVTTGRYEDDRTDRDRRMLDVPGERVNSATPA